MSRIDKSQITDAIRLLAALRREAKQTDKAVAKLVGKLSRLPELREALPSPRYLRQIAEAADELSTSLMAAACDCQRLPSAKHAGRFVR